MQSQSEKEVSVPCRVHVSTIVLPQTLHPSARSRHRFRYIEFNFISLLPPIWAQGSWVSRVFSLSFMRSYCGYHRPLSMRRPAVFSRLSRMCLSWWLRRRFCCLCQIHRPLFPGEVAGARHLNSRRREAQSRSRERQHLLPYLADVLLAFYTWSFWR